MSEDISKNQKSKLCSKESKVLLNFFVLFRFVVFASNTKDSLSLLGCHFPNPNLKIANYPLIPTARVRPMISITPKKACEGTCIFESTFKQSITEKLFFFRLSTFMHKPQVRQKGYLIKIQNYVLHKNTHWKYCCTKAVIYSFSFKFIILFWKNLLPKLWNCKSV